MKRITISERDRRTLTIGAVLLIGGVGYVKGLKPYREAYADASAQLADGRNALAKEQAEVAAAQKNPMLQHVADSAMDAMGQRLFIGKDSVAASDALAQYLKVIATEAHAYLSQRRTQGTTTLPTGVRVLRVQITAQSDIQGMIAFLDSVEHGDHLVCVEKMQMAILTSVDTTKGVQELQLTATMDGYQVPSPLDLQGTVAAASAPAAGAPAVGAGAALASAAGAAVGAPAGAGRGMANAAPPPCDPTPPGAASSPAVRRVGQ